MKQLCIFYTFRLYVWFKYIYYISRKYKNNVNFININMKNLCKIFFLLLFFLLPYNAEARSKANIYAFSRDLPKKQIISESGFRASLGEFDGDFVIAIFWSRYCVPCIKELKSLSNFVKETRTNGIRVLMISPKSEWVSGFVEQREFMRRFGAENLEIYVDEKEAVASALGIFSSPISILISREGREIGRIRGSLKWDDQDVIEYIYKVKAEKG